ncbi:hypothetical protein SRHO_G00193720 [Serrasalmus rhombeus]
MGKDQELLQAVKTEDLLTVQKILQRPKPGKASRCIIIIMSSCSSAWVCMGAKLLVWAPDLVSLRYTYLIKPDCWFVPNPVPCSPSPYTSKQTKIAP